MQTRVNSQLSAIRKARGVSAADLAGRVGVSRQTIYAIEAGSYVPNTEVTLRLARELQVSVEEIFSLHDNKVDEPLSLQTEVLSAQPPVKGQAVRICQMGDRMVSVPVTAAPYYLPEADGVIGRVSRSHAKAELMVFAKDETYHKKLLLAGCDPAVGLLSRMVEKAAGVEIVSASAASRLALTWLKEGKVHIAGTHLKDAGSGEFNLPFVRSEFPDGDCAVVTFARWEEGLVMAPGNPKGIRAVADLAKRSVRFIHREAGSGSRALLDQLLSDAGIPSAKIGGCDRIAYGHLAASYAVLTNEADCCLATRSAAQAFGLDFMPLQSERYDFVMRRATLELPAAQTFLEILQRASLRRKLEVLAGYDTAETGAIQA
jgi:molybdate-binding protein/DNA-binding XRE family transcriptional regulator